MHRETGVPPVLERMVRLCVFIMSRREGVESAWFLFACVPVRVVWAVRDCYEREITYLRISVTERCNFRCFYCRPSEGGPPPRPDMSVEDIVRVVEAGSAVGIRKLRLTGGEPLVRPDIVELTARLAAVDRIDDLAITTNGSLLARYAAELKEAGLKRVNISLDTLKPDLFHRITGRDRFADIRAGIRASFDHGLEPVKLNMVVMRGINDDEVLDMAALTARQPLHVRFIELMPIGESSERTREQLVTCTEMKTRIEDRYGALEPIASIGGVGPARYWRIPGAPGTVGFIAPLSGYFCHACNRMRLTAAGTLRPCLCQGVELDLKEALAGGADREELAALIARAISRKPKGHGENTIDPVRDKLMSQIGG